MKPLSLKIAMLFNLLCTLLCPLIPVFINGFDFHNVALYISLFIYAYIISSFIISLIWTISAITKQGIVKEWDEFFYIGGSSITKLNWSYKIGRAHV